jgi:cleavage and polyadenylation specificity factor subunit 4
VPKNGRGPERTVGGFEKQRGEQRSGARAIAITGSVGAGAGAGAAVTGASVGAGESLLSSSAKEKASALSHVPCRFFKAGACTAGSACQFSHDGE